jgi:hypothetical protein
MANPFEALLEEFKKAPPAGKVLAVVAVVAVAGIGLYTGLHKNATGASGSGTILPVDPTLTGGDTGIPFPNLSSPIAGGLSVPASPTYQKQTINPLGKNSGVSNNFYQYTTNGTETIASLNAKAGWNGTSNNVQFYRNNADILRQIGYTDANGSPINANATLPSGVKLSL